MSTFKILFLSIVFFSCSIWSTYPTYLGVVSSYFSYFVSIFIRVFSFVRISDIFACYSQDYHRSFVFACFLVFIASWVIYTNLDCVAKIGYIWCWFQFYKNHKKVRREVWACEDIKSVWVKHERCEDFFSTNQFLQVLSCQIKTTHRALPM